MHVLARWVVSLCAHRPSIHPDISYAGRIISSGAPIRGYEAPNAWIKRDAIGAQKHSSSALARKSCRLNCEKMDCYRHRRGGERNGVEGAQTRETPATPRPSGGYNPAFRHRRKTGSGWAISPSIPAHSTGARHRFLSLVDLKGRQFGSVRPQHSLRRRTAEVRRPRHPRKPESIWAPARELLPI